LSAPSMPRPLVGLAAAALAAGLLWLPLAAYADPTPTPELSAASSPTPKPSTSAEQANESAMPSAAASDAAESDGPSRDPSASQSGSGETSSTPEADVTTVGRARSDAAQALAPAAPTPTTQTPSERVQAQAAGISLTKSASPTRVSRVGQVITYRFAVANPGTVLLEDVTITDELDGLSTPDCPETELQPGTGMTCTATLRVTQDWLDFGDIDNSATVFGSFGSEGVTDYVGANASAHVSVDQRPSIALDASVSPTGTADAGDRLRYRATATNTGNVTLTAARITSSLDSLDLDCDPSARASLAPGASISCAGSYRVSNADARRGRVSNELTARAAGPYAERQVIDDVTLRVRVTKPPATADPGLADTGGPVGTWPVGAVGLAALVAGASLLRRGQFLNHRVD
jgi:uncharacterized repeat protein (TIGR01451 family)